jgi:hypothetical protein
VDLYLYSPNTPSWHGAQLKKCTRSTLSLPLLYKSGVKIPQRVQELKEEIDK